MSLDNTSHPGRPGPDELVPSRYALRVGEIDVLVVSDGVLSLPGAMLAHNADPAVREAWLKDMFLPPNVLEWALNVVHVHVGKYHVVHGRKIDAGGLQSQGQPPSPRQVRVLHPHPGVDEYGPAAATHHDHVQRPLEHVRRQEHVFQPGRPDGRVGVVGQHRAWQR